MQHGAIQLVTNGYCVGKQEVGNSHILASGPEELVLGNFYRRLCSGKSLTVTVLASLRPSAQWI